MRKTLLFISVFVVAGVVLISPGNPFLYLAIASLIPLAYAYMKKKNSPLFAVMIGMAFVGSGISVPWDIAHIIAISVLWPGVFALFAMHSTPPSEDMEKLGLQTWGMTSMLSAGAIYMMASVAPYITNAFALAIVGLMVGLALAYLAWK